MPGIMLQYLHTRVRTARVKSRRSDYNYAVISQKQKIDAFEKGGIPSDKIVGLNALLLIPAAAYMLLNRSTRDCGSNAHSTHRPGG